MIDENESNEVLQGILQDLNFLKERDTDNLIEDIKKSKFLPQWKIDMILHILRYDDNN